MTLAHFVSSWMFASLWFAYGMEWAERLCYLVMTLNSAAHLFQEIRGQVSISAAPCQLGLGDLSETLGWV